MPISKTRHSQEIWLLPPLTEWEQSEVNPKRILDILRWFEDMYGNTFQNTSVWALEYELLARMLFHNRSLLFNPLHLNLPEVEDELCCRCWTLSTGICTKRRELSRRMKSSGYTRKIKETTQWSKSDYPHRQRYAAGPSKSYTGVCSLMKIWLSF